MDLDYAYRLWVDWNMVVRNCLGGSWNKSFGAWVGRDSRAHSVGWGIPYPGHLVY